MTAIQVETSKQIELVITKPTPQGLRIGVYIIRTRSRRGRKLGYTYYECYDDMLDIRQERRDFSVKEEIGDHCCDKLLNGFTVAHTGSTYILNNHE